MRIILVVGVLVGGLLAGCATSPPTPAATSPYLNAAIRAARWLQVESSGGWDPAARFPRPGEQGASNLGSGAAGRAVFFAELYCATGDPSFRTSAVADARSALAGAGPGEDDYGLYTGLSGIAVSLAETGAAVDEGDLRRAARQLFRRIALAADVAHGVRGWGDVYDVLGGWAGVGLSLLYAFEEFDDPTFLEAAVTAGDALLGVGDPVFEGGMRWVRGERMDHDLPNFSHGTAGVGYFMARLGEVSGLPRFSEAALRAVEYLDQIADRRDGLYLVPYGVPNEGYVTPYDIGWAHGPAGTSRLHYAIWMQTQDPDLRNRVEAGARAIVASGVPGESEDRARWSSPFRIDRRFGTSGAAAFLIDWGLVTENGRHLEVAAHVTDDILERATNTANGIFWRLPLYGFQGPEVDGVFMGYFYGSAGLGLTLLQQHYAGIGLRPRIRLPDDPFPGHRGPAAGFRIR